ncbi:Ribonuclease J2 [Geodia barretti]|uniref:Ribonuclease J2 n=1 Tax=Geodia barretti TaxID=519541 RepID=A0AA35W8V8_GEOBA|nr:Ribonuclease J2 [Geodia barretti]
MLGVDLIIPDVSYLVERSDRVRGILITHGHEDHIGALPHILPQLNVPVFAPKLAHGLIAVKLHENRATRGISAQPIEPGVDYQLVIHTGDFKIDHTPVDGHTIDLNTLAHYGNEGVLLLCSDSTYAEIPGYTASEQILGGALDRAIGDAPGRVMVATFASLISRVQQVIDAAASHNRKVAIVGRSMADNVSMAAEMGYLDLPPDTLVSLNEIRGYSPERTVLITTGSQGEPTSALVRIANKDHRDVSVMEGDTVVISATPIPGNELLVSRTIDNLLRQGARVLYDRIALVHVHGHASQEELKMMLSLTRPRYFVPVHGEYRHLMAHAKLAWDMGLAESGIFVLEDGDVLELSEDGGRVVESVSAGPIFIDGPVTRDVRSEVLRERKALARDGVVVLVVSVDGQTGQPASPTKVLASGFMDDSETDDLFPRLSVLIDDLVKDRQEFAEEPERVKNLVREAAGRFLQTEARRRPTIVTVLLES